MLRDQYFEVLVHKTPARAKVPILEQFGKRQCIAGEYLVIKMLSVQKTKGFGIGLPVDFLPFTQRKPMHRKPVTFKKS